MTTKIDGSMPAPIPAPTRAPLSAPLTAPLTAPLSAQLPADQVVPRAPEPGPLVALLSFGTGGDVQPFVALADGLRRRSHRTLALVPAFHAGLARCSGVDHTLFGAPADTQAMLDDPDLWHERKGFGVVWRGVLPGLDDVVGRLTALAQAGPCVVVSHPFLLPVAAMVRERQPHLRLVGAYLAPSSLRTLHDPLTVGSLDVPRWVPRLARRWLWAVIDRHGIDPELLPGLNAARASHGLAPVAHYLPHMQACADASIGLFPPWYGPRQPDWPAGFVDGDFPLPPRAAGAVLAPALEAFLAAGEPPIAFTPGTGHRHARAYFANAASTLQALGRCGLFVTPFADQLPATLPPGVLHVAQAPFEALLPRLALLVHHGGIGTTAEALRAGLPQLIVPFAFDQFDNGRRIAQLGAGAVLPASRASARRMVRCIGRLLQAPPRPGPGGAPGPGAVDGGMQRLLDRVEQVLRGP